MNIKVLINGRIQEPPPVAGLRELAEQVLTAQGIDPNAELSLVITDRETIQKLNHHTFGVNMPTDVLAFPAFAAVPNGQKARHNDPWALGEVVVSYPAALDQAAKCCQSVDKEMAHLITRGTLKLLGVEHDPKCDLNAKEQHILGCLSVE